MQPNPNRPVYIVQPSNITHLNVRPTIIATGGQPGQTQQPQTSAHQISTVRQPILSQQASPIYQVQPQFQSRLVSPSPAYTSLQAPRFATTSPGQIITMNTNLSPRQITPQATTPRMSMLATQPTTTILRPTLTAVSTSPKVTSIPTSTPLVSTTATPAQTAASTSKDISVKVPKTRAQYGIMEFANGLSIDVKDWKALEMRREINPYTYRAPTNLDANAASSSSTTITTSLGVVIPKTGAGSEYGREQKEALKRKRFATKGTNLEDLPWLLTDRSSTEKKLKHYRGLKKGGVSTNSSYYVFIQGKDGFEAYPVEDWYGFTPTNVYKTLDFEEAEKQYQERHKNLSKWFLKHQVTKEKDGDDTIEDDGDDKGKKSNNKNKRAFKLLDTEDWVHENEEEEEDREDDDDNEKSNKKAKTTKNNNKPKDAWTLSDDDDEEESKPAPPKAKKSKTTQRQTSEDKEDSDDGDHDCDEIDYTSDETSDEEEDIKGGHTDKSSTKYEVKGVDEEMKAIPDIDKKLEQMDENGDEVDFDDDDEEIFDIEDNDDENGKTDADDLADVSKILKSEAINKEMESSSDDDLDDSDDPDKESIEPIAASSSNQPPPLAQVKTEKGHKKAREEELRAIKSQVMSLPTTPSNPSETITEEKVRNLLQRKQYMSSKELIQNFLPKSENLRTKEVKEGIVQKLATILKRLNIEEKVHQGKKYLKLKTT